MDIMSNAGSFATDPITVHEGRTREVEEFDNTKAGVKGLVDSGLTKIPEFFIIRPPASLARQSPDLTVTGLRPPVVDIGGSDGPGRKAITEDIRKASETWGFFQVVNHAIPQGIMENVLGSIQRFHEQQVELKREFYSRDSSKTLRYYSTGNLLSSQAATWRDSVAIHFQDGVIDAKALPQICRKEVCDYLEQIVNVRRRLSELLSEALGLSHGYLDALECMGSELMLCHYYPSCPEPELTLGTVEHTDPSFLTILLQDDCGGLQVLHKDHWFDVSPVKGALVINIGDMMQLITNDRFKSVCHRVLVKRGGPRLSIACFCQPKAKNMFKPHEPIKELLSETDPPIYRPATAAEYHSKHKQMQLLGSAALPYFKVVLHQSV